MRKFILQWALFLALFPWGCAPGGTRPGEGGLTVAVAANVQFAMEEIEAAFESDTGIPVEVILGSSGKLSAQIRKGAPFDLLVSADTRYPAFLFEEKKAALPPRVYAYGSLVLWTVRDHDLSSGLDLLTEPFIRKIAVPNPRTAPYGEQAMLLLERAGLAGVVKPRLVFGESIAQTNQYIQSGACDLGFTAKSVVMSPALTGQGHWVDLDKSLYEPIAQSAIITSHGHSQHPGESRLFFDFLFSEKGRAVFQKFGYELPR